MEKETLRKKYKHHHNEPHNDKEVKHNINKTLISNEKQQNPLIPNQNFSTEKGNYPVSQFKIPLPKTKPNTDFNYCCIYFDGTKWEKSKKQMKTQTSKTQFKKRSEQNVFKNDRKIKKIKDEKKGREKSPLAIKISDNKFYKRRSKHYFTGPDYLRFCRKPILVSREIQTETTAVNENRGAESHSGSSEDTSSTQSEILKKIEVHRKTLEAKYSEERIRKLIEKIKRNPHINDNILKMFQQKKLKERRSNLSKQTFPLIEICSTDAPVENVLEISDLDKKNKKDGIPEALHQTKMPHRRISDRELVEIYETKNGENQKTPPKPDKRELKPPRPQIPRRIITEEEKDFRLQQFEKLIPVPKARPTIPRKKLTEPPPKENLIFLTNVPLNNLQKPSKIEDSNMFEDQFASALATVSSRDIYKKIKQRSDDISQESVDLSNLFLKILSKKKPPEVTVTTNLLKIEGPSCGDCSKRIVEIPNDNEIPREEIRQPEIQKTEIAKICNTKDQNVATKSDKGINVPSCSNVKVEIKTAKVKSAKEERKIKTLWTIRNSRFRKQNADTLKNRTLKILSKEKILKKQSQVTFKESLSFVAAQKGNSRIILDCSTPSSPREPKDRSLEREMKPKSEEIDKRPKSAMREELTSKIQQFLKKREVYFNNIPQIECDKSNIPIPEKPKFLEKLKSEFGSSKTSRNELQMSQSAVNLKAQTCPSITSTVKNSRTQMKHLTPKISKSMNLTPKLMKSINTINQNPNLKCPGPESTVSGKTQGTTEKKWAAGSIYNSTLLFTKVNKDSDKESSFKKRKEYYKMLRTKQKPLSAKCFSNTQNRGQSTKNVYYSRIDTLPQMETFPKRRNFNEHINFSTCFNVGLDFLYQNEIDITENENKENELEIENQLNFELNDGIFHDGKIDFLVPVHNFKSESEVGTYEFDGNFSLCSVESGIQSFTTSTDTKKSFTDLYKQSKSAELCDSKLKHKNKLKRLKKNYLNESSSRAYTIAPCSVITTNQNDNSILTDIINLNEDIYKDAYTFNKYYSNHEQARVDEAFKSSSTAIDSQDSGIEVIKTLSTSNTKSNSNIKKKKYKIWNIMRKIFKKKYRK